jgi:hypothetical protein
MDAEFKRYRLQDTGQDKCTAANDQVTQGKKIKDTGHVTISEKSCRLCREVVSDAVASDNGSFGLEQACRKVVGQSLGNGG